MTSAFQLGMFWQQSDLAIRAVALGLMAMSVACWYLIVLHGRRQWRLRRAAAAMDGFWHAASFEQGLATLDAAGGGIANPYRLLALACRQAVQHHRDNQQDLHGQLSLADWLSESLSGAIDECAEQLQSGLSMLASVGSTAPFIGLFGTVWGIYHALVNLGVAGQSTLDKVAGPVGEALIMTAFGLAVAIPAVLGYNALTRANRRVISRMQRFARQLHAYSLTGSATQPLTARED
ncbi:MAG: MotA/TolQ/ExbB proton channel family protein [Paludibacterium sp.]|uniref:MotA/TolQ/ExbB proton channel family protein n=1 Tax=Paludibacterium sp. TaxID=1917523 RepID=UPI0025F8970A|nr:MotA/TolQ/ExbB proton channel family protein [Paludibacterium sp.]MBV8047861.1 MotA/TolQ/ExbB proton channel family protein [Paludibacterium sp.]MBV8648154.1 MotA/TolQ/ExbB proton channel family protein [Paludibacterium sp.]